jgi:ABC-2 type transport system ATP-binding protein
MAGASIELSAVNKSFGSTRAVRDLDLVVPRGSLCGFLGPNGAGKTTTLRMIMSIIYPDSGSIDVLGGNALRSKDRIGYLPEERGLYRKVRVGEFLQYIARLKGVRRPNLAGYVKEWLERVELPDVDRKKCEELSKGMQQKVQFLSAILHEPELLIFDEPFSGLDPVNAELLNRIIRELHDQGRTVIFSTHILHQAEQICDRIFLINKGAKLLDATLEEIRQRFDPRTIVAEPLDGDADLSRIPGVRDVRRLHDTKGLELEFDDGADPQEIMKSVLAGHPMRSIELRRLSLDEVFVQLVLQDAGSNAAELAREELGHV